MRDGYGFLYFLITFMIISLFIRVFWPVILVLIVVIIIYYIYIKYKINKQIRDQVNQINEKYDYDSWVNDANSSNNKDIIDVEFTERREDE